jgi:hypothetical protein
VRARLKNKIVLYSTALLILSVAALLFVHNVSGAITPEDEIYIHEILKQTGSDDQIKDLESYEGQITAIIGIQNSAFKIAPQTRLIPLDQPREPKDLLLAKAAYCSDRARFIEKALRLYGFKTRFASIYENTPDKNFMQTLVTKGIEGAHSHAIVEVQTAKGWLVIDTRTHWISLDKDDNPVSLNELAGFAESKTWPSWSSQSKEDMYFLMKDPFYILYGVYSRHGRFYPPYTPYIPDIDFTQFVYNFST